MADGRTEEALNNKVTDCVRVGICLIVFFRYMSDCWAELTQIIETMTWINEWPHARTDNKMAEYDEVLMYLACEAFFDCNSSESNDEYLMTVVDAGLDSD